MWYLIGRNTKMVAARRESFCEVIKASKEFGGFGQFQIFYKKSRAHKG